MLTAFWICGSVTVVSSLISSAFAVAALRGSSSETRSFSSYALARSFALTVVSIIALVSSSVPFEAAVAIAMIIVQALDSAIGGRLHDRAKTIGPAVLAVANFIALFWLISRGGSL